MGLCVSRDPPPHLESNLLPIPKSQEQLLSLNRALSCAEIFALLRGSSEMSLHRARRLMETLPPLDYEMIFEGYSPLHALAASTKTGFEWTVRGSAPTCIEIHDDLLNEIYTMIMRGTPRSILSGLTQIATENMNALHIAILHGNDVIAKRLLAERDIDIHAVTQPSRRSTLMCAARIGNSEILGILIERGADINARTANGETALMIGASFCQPRIVRHLLTFLHLELELDVVDHRGRTASDLAIAMRDRVQNSPPHVRDVWMAEAEQNCALFIAAAKWNETRYLHLERAIKQVVTELPEQLLKQIISFLGGPVE